PQDLHSFPTRRSSDLIAKNPWPKLRPPKLKSIAVLHAKYTYVPKAGVLTRTAISLCAVWWNVPKKTRYRLMSSIRRLKKPKVVRSEEHTSELQSRENL